jgi:2-haloacid dehalogenase
LKHTLFLFDLDDTLLDFKASEQLSFVRTLEALGVHDGIDALFPQYQAINIALWREFELGTVSKDFLKVERFRRPSRRTASSSIRRPPATSTWNRCRRPWS